MEFILNFLQKNLFVIIYILIVLFTSASVFIIYIKKLRLIKRKKKERLKGKKQFAAIKSESPLDDPVKKAKEIGLISIEKRFTISRKIIIPVIAFITIIFIIVPFINYMPATFLSVVIGTLSIIIGIAAKTYIENVIAGIVLNRARVLNIGDTVLINNYYGRIEDIKLTYTTIKIWDWRRYIIPNTKMLQNEFINYNLEDTYQWAYIEFCVSYENDIDKVKKISIESALKSSYIAKYEDPKFWIMKMEKFNIVCWLAAWANSATDAWYLKNDIRTELIKQFQLNNIKIHYVRHTFEDMENLSEKTIH